MTKTFTSLAIALVLLAFTLPAMAQEAAQATDEDGQFYLGFAGSAVFPYAPKGPPDLASAEVNFASGAGFTGAFGYAFKEGFSTEIEWGYQKAGIDAPTANLFQNTDLGGFLDFGAGFEDLTLPRSPLRSIAIEVDGAIKTQSLMGNFYYRYPKWRVSPYVGFGLGVFFHDGTFTSTINIETDLFAEFSDIIVLPASLPSLKTTVTYDDSRFAYQIMAGFLVRATQRVEFRFGYRFRSSRGEPIDADQLEAGIRFRL